MSALRTSAASSASTSSSRAVSPAGLPPGTARQPPHDELAQPPDDYVGGRPRSQPLQLVQRPPQRLLLVRIGRR